MLDAQSDLGYARKISDTRDMREGHGVWLFDSGECAGRPLAAKIEEKEMKTDEAILAFSESEKIKAGLIWVSQAVGLLQGLHEAESKGGATVLTAMIRMLAQETRIAQQMTGGDEWDGVDEHLERAVNMVNSGVGHEATIHLTRALSLVTNIGLHAMTTLKDKSLL